MDKRYPKDLFWFHFFQTFLFHHIFLWLPGITLLIVGIWVRPCLYVGLGFLVMDLIASYLNAVRTRDVFLNSDNPNFKEAQDAVLSENWRENLQQMAENKSGENKE